MVCGTDASKNIHVPFTCLERICICQMHLQFQGAQGHRWEKKDDAPCVAFQDKGQPEVCFFPSDVSKKCQCFCSRFLILLILWGKIFKYRLSDSSPANSPPQGDARNNMTDPFDSSTKKFLVCFTVNSHILPHHSKNTQWLSSFKSQ